MITTDRRALILEDLVRQGSLSVDEIAAKFGLSRVTIRTDLNHLAQNGALIRTRGGAVARSYLNLAATVRERSKQRHAQKVNIARAAVALIQDGETIVLDGGTTVLEIARQLPPVSNLTVVTGSIDIASELFARPGIELHMLGGRIDHQTSSAIGASAELQLTGFIAHKTFLGANAVDEHSDVVDISTDVARIKRSMAQIGRQTILVADSSKWGISAPAKALPLTDFDLVITDKGLAEEARNYLAGHGIATTLT